MVSLYSNKDDQFLIFWSRWRAFPTTTKEINHVLKMDGSIVVSALVKIVVDKFASIALNEYGLPWGVKNDLATLESTISTIRDVLDDAEQCCLNNKQVYNWLMELKEVVYDADDLLDKIFLETEKLKTESNGRTSKVFSNFLSSVNMIKPLKLGHKIKSINKRIDSIAAKKAKFHLQSMIVDHSEKNIEYRETLSRVDENSIFGRDNEREKIVNQLMQFDGNENVSIISIVGLGGMGKTTLAKLVYNNEDEIKAYFHLKIWVYVSRYFDVQRIVRNMIESISTRKCKLQNLDVLVNKLATELKGKRFLLVLDDIWNEDPLEWENLKVVLKCGEFGSKIIATTRSMRVSQIMKSTQTIVLEVLSKEMSWNLFKQNAFSESERELHPGILEIAKEIVKKCGGVPLALKALGTTMQFMKSIDEWLAARDSDIWKMDGGDGVIASLRLSYLNLPSQLKECFCYCSIFPKGYVIYKDELIDQWMAHGLVPFMEVHKGKEYFEQLVQICFLQNVDEEKNGLVSCCMHDLVHDLAQFIVAPEFSVKKGTDVQRNKDVGCRYMSLINFVGKVEPTIIKKLRAIHIDGGNSSAVVTFSKAKRLRSFVLDRIVSDTLSIRISKFIHLRYLCISRCEFTVIPNDIGVLWSLHALRLRQCDKITYLPESIGKLINLRTLEISLSKLKSLPKSIGQCLSLQNLIVTCSQIESVPNSLCQLVNVRSLNFSCCSKLERLSDDAFGEFHFIRSISFSGCHYLERIPVSIGRLVSLESLNLSECKKLKYLPESIGNLRNLRVLNLQFSGIVMLPSSIYQLDNLTTLNLVNAPLSRGMPIGIGKFAGVDLQGLIIDCRNIGKNAYFSELENLNFLSGYLEIRGLGYLYDRHEATKANLKAKKNLDQLKLSWSWDDIFIDGFTNWMPVVEALQPPSSIKSLELHGYPANKYPNWMMLVGDMNTTAFPYLTTLSLSHFKFGSSLPFLVELPHLRYLYLQNVVRLTFFKGHFPSLVELRLSKLPNLEELVTMNQGTNKVYISNFPCLSKLVISGCPKLRMRPHLPPSVLELEFEKSNKELLDGVVLSQGESPEFCSSSFSLRILSIREMKLPTKCVLLKHLSSLRTLEFSRCKLNCLPESMRHLSILSVLKIKNCNGLHALPEWLGELKSLKNLIIWRASLTCLDKSIQQLTGLQTLRILDCPELKRRCGNGKGEYWPLISHIPDVFIE